MFQAVLNAVLVCHHRRTTFPVSPGRTAAGALPRTYIVCLDCGTELPYDWNHMRVMPSTVRAAKPRGLEPHPPVRRAPPAVVLPAATVPVEEIARAVDVREPPCAPDQTSAALPDIRAAGPIRAEVHESTPDLGSPWSPGKAPLPAAMAPAADRPYAVAGSGQYMVRAKLRMQQVQVALRVLNALMTGLSAQPDDVAKLRSWTDPSHQACSTRDLAQRVVACAVSL